MLIGADQIRALIPHSGNMCLLERVLNWNENSIRCETNRHLDLDNPLRRNGHLSSICGIEFAAQAMALHGALNSDSGPPTRHGYLTSIRDANCTAATLDGYDSSLHVSAELVFADGPRVIYTFAVESAGVMLISGRASVMLRQK